MNNRIHTLTIASVGVLIGACITTVMNYIYVKKLEPKFRQRRNDEGWGLRPIGVVRSCYRLCVGTPRQGMLAPHARGRIELSVDEDALDGLAEFGYVWIVFGFHLNTVGAKTRTKIAAPARGATGRVGVLATRSPHRFNCVGITLAKLDQVEVLVRRNHRNRPKRIPCIKISGHDLVDGTPVFDIKPYVAYYDSVSKASVPEWVDQGLKSHREVIFEDAASIDLENLIGRLEFYDSLVDIRCCIKEVLSVDVRSTWQTKKARSGQFRAEQSSRLGGTKESVNASGVCTQQLDNLLISYIVQAAETVQREESIGSGAEDVVVVQSIRLLDKQT